MNYQRKPRLTFGQTWPRPGLRKHPRNHRQRFDRDGTDIFDLEDEISQLVASRIEPELGLTEQRKAERRPRKNMGAWEQAIEQFETAIS